MSHCIQELIIGLYILEWRAAGCCQHLIEHRSHGFNIYLHHGRNDCRQERQNPRQS